MLPDFIKEFLNKYTAKPLRRKLYQERYNLSLRDWLIYHQKEVVFDQVKWMGVPVWKNVLDAWIYQEIIYEVQPDVIVEIGSRYGGSTKYFANLLDILDKGMVISIDPYREDYNFTHKRVKVLTGKSSDLDILAEVEDLCCDKGVFVIQDGDHSKTQALEDLENYSKFVSIGSYFIMEDGIVDLFHDGDGLGFKKDNPGPLEAVEDFLSRNPNFAVDSTRERYLLTYNPKGFLKRIS
ncbi:Cephalosporin hydroxylase family protein [Desulfonema limicola]|uniref:Cephalosporin hydroxylase family protein n=1 Tax=Desulfonema limicola TaxID=45656 RepID=A0A975B7Q5_9BACT|nr:CmcI family methyltransferase [Desulfonema limicola]QTA80407.1 Cephalosporin hydroxylase family protein [Desulfonema limicola]